MKQLTEDNYEGALLALSNVVMRLYGGQYEPRSQRDSSLADELYAILHKHRMNPCPPQQYLQQQLF